MDGHATADSNPSSPTPRSETFAVETTALIDFISAKVCRGVSADIIQREERRGKRNALIFSVLGLLGLSGVTGVVSWRIEAAADERLTAALIDLKPTITTIAAREVSQQISEVERRLQENDMLQEFIEVVGRLRESKDGFSQALRDDAMIRIRGIAAIQRLAAGSRFVGAMRDVVERFAAAGLDQAVDEIDSLVGESIKRDDTIARTLGDHYGENVIGSPVGVERNTEQIARMQKYLYASTVAGYPEKQKMWELFIEFKRQQFADGPITGRIVESLDDLNEADRDNLYRFLGLYSAPENWQKIVNQEGREMERLVQALFDVYPALAGAVDQYARRSAPEQRASVF